MTYDQVFQLIMIIVIIGGVLLVLVTVESLIEYAHQRKEHKRMHERLDYINSVRGRNDS